MNVIEKSSGTHIAYDTTTTSVIFGDEDLSINLKNREKDDPVTIDICLDKDGELTMGTASGYKYAAQVLIPARSYTTVEGDADEDGNATYTQEAADFDIDNCTLYLFAID